MAEPQRLSTADQTTPRPQRMLRVRIEHIWLALPIALIICFGFLKKLPVLDFWWHLKAGEIIINTGSIPRTELFSFTSAGKQFVLQNWLVEVLYYLIYRAGGLPLLVVFNTSLLVAALVPVYLLCREATVRLRLSVVATLMSTMSLVYFGSMRSQVFSFLFLSIFYWVLSVYRRRRRSLLWILPLLMVMWVNLHGAFVLGLGLIGLFLGCEIIRRFVHGPRQDTLSTRELGGLGLILVFTALATLVNPETYKIYSYIRAVAASQPFVLEWQPPRIAEIEGVILFYGPFFITLLVLLYSKQKPELIDLALFIVFAIFGLMAIRNGVWFALIASPILARYLPTIDLSGLIESLRRFRRINAMALWMARRKEAEAPIRYRLNRQIAVLLLTITVLVSPWIYPHLGNELFGDALWEKSTPVKAMDYIQQQGLKGNIFHPQIYGDYLIWRLWPQQRSFIDGRVHLFAESVIRDYRLAFHDSHWEERLSRYDIRYLLLSKDEEENHMMADSARSSAKWRVLHEDDLAILFEKAD